MRGIFTLSFREHSEEWTGSQCQQNPNVWFDSCFFPILILEGDSVGTRLILQTGCGSPRLLPAPNHPGIYQRSQELSCKNFPVAASVVNCQLSFLTLICNAILLCRNFLGYFTEHRWRKVSLATGITWNTEKLSGDSACFCTWKKGAFFLVLFPVGCNRKTQTHNLTFLAYFPIFKQMKLKNFRQASFK